MNPLRNKHREGHLARTPAIAATLLLLSSTLSTPSYAGITRHDQPREPLGSLSGVGDVYLNDSPAAAESAILPGDRVRTGVTGTASFAVNGKGTLRILPRSQVAFSGGDQFAAELEAGTIVSNSMAGADGVILRIGNYVVVPSVGEQAATFRITRAQDGSFLVSCLGGGVGVLTLEGKGQFLQGGQSLTVSEKQEVLPAPASAKRKSNFPTRWLVLGLAGAGAGAAVAAKLAHGGGGSNPGNPTVTIP